MLKPDFWFTPVYYILKICPLRLPYDCTGNPYICNVLCARTWKMGNTCIACAHIMLTFTRFAQNTSEYTCIVGLYHACSYTWGPKAINLTPLFEDIWITLSSLVDLLHTKGLRNIVCGGTGSTWGHNFYMGVQIESKLEIWWRRLLIQASELVMALWSFPMFA